MARVETTKDIDPTQLGIELGRVALRVGGGYVASDAVDQATLEAGVAAHAADPAYVDPNPAPPPIEEQNRQTLEQRADQALQTNATYIALASPTNAQHFAQLKAVTQECSALIRLLLRRLDATD